LVLFFVGCGSNYVEIPKRRSPIGLDITETTSANWNGERKARL